MQSVRNVLNKIPNVDGFVKKTDYVTEIISIKNDYATKAILDTYISTFLSKSHLLKKLITQ